MRRRHRLGLLLLLGVLVVLAYGQSHAGADTSHGWPNHPPDLVTYSFLGKQKGTCEWWVYPNGYIKRCYWPPKKAAAGAA